MNLSAVLIAITFLASSTFDLRSFSEHEMKIYKKSSTEETAPPVEEPQFEPLFDEWKSIIQDHSRDNLYNHVHKRKNRK